mmetsp:Transcript_53631/g.129167  ORF Transcript_53631/g.129167 Transcript_53631/m.129167 type:complete len:225 (+) Transcript_53631:958-1632(+)
MLRLRARDEQCPGHPLPRRLWGGPGRGRRVGHELRRDEPLRAFPRGHPLGCVERALPDARAALGALHLALRAGRLPLCVWLDRRLIRGLASGAGGGLCLCGVREHGGRHQLRDRAVHDPAGLGHCLGGCWCRWNLWRSRCHMVILQVHRGPPDPIQAPRGLRPVLGADGAVHALGSLRLHVRTAQSDRRSTDSSGRAGQGCGCGCSTFSRGGCGCGVGGLRLWT